MLGYKPPTEKSNTKKLKLLLENLENLVAILKEELDVGQDEDNNIIALDEFLHNIQENYETTEPEYQEEDE